MTLGAARIEPGSFTTYDKAAFWETVIRRGPDDCWPSINVNKTSGYGFFHFKGRYWLAHRLAYAIHYGSDPGPLLVRHKCDNPLCCNPAHLVVGTNLDNARDRQERGRYPGSKVDRALALAYRDTGLTYKAIGERLGCSETAVYYAIHGQYERRPRSAEITKYDEAKFWATVIRRGPDDCWPSINVQKRSGYGTFKLNGRMYRAHRLAYQLHYGVDPGELYVRHRCDNPPCCNPAHLVLGTAADNARDMSERGRGRPAQFDPVLAQSYSDLGLTNERIAELMGCTGVTVARLLKRRC